MMKWAHLLCAMWIPEVSLGNATFQEPVQDVEKVPKTRWKLVCMPHARYELN
jgi:NuA3 HAT complex component NTO1